MANAPNYIGGGDTAQKKMYTGMGDTAHTLLMWGTIGVGTLHNIERKNYETYNNERKEKVFASKSKFQIKRFS